MKKGIKFLSGFMGILLTVLIMPLNGIAEEQKIHIVGQMYQCGEKSDYHIASSKLVGTTDEWKTLGNLYISGELSKTNAVNGFTAYQAAENSLFSISYEYHNTLMNADKEDWHLTDDNQKTVNSIDLNERIGYGAIILQTSLDGSHWVDDSVITDFSEDVLIGDIQEIQLMNGCYYRVIVAFKTEKTTQGTFDINQLENTRLTTNVCQEYAEIYEFYASYGNSEAESTGEAFNDDGISNTVRKNKDGYTGNGAIEERHSHYGWTLGEFSLNGYASQNEEIYYKSIGDKVKLSYTLKQNIDALNGNTNLIIADESSNYDEEFQSEVHDMGRGELIVKFTDENGESEITEYSNFLESTALPESAITIQFLDEGDYEVHLNYAVTDKKWITSTTTYYQNAFSFKIRNHNCAIYLYDTWTEEELQHKDITQDGFYIDIEQSGNPKLTIKKEILNSTGTRLIQDRNSDGTELNFTEEGLYTVSAFNKYDDQIEPAVKMIYIGNNPLMIAYLRYLDSEGYTIEDLNALLEQGWTIAENGELIEPVTETEPETVRISVIETTESEPESTELAVIETEIPMEQPQQSEIPVLPLTGTGAGIVVLNSLLTSAFRRKKD